MNGVLAATQMRHMPSRKVAKDVMAPGKPTKACVPCRNRKTKCDAATTGLPCSGCVSRQCPDRCVVSARKPRKRLVEFPGFAPWCLPGLCTTLTQHRAAPKPLAKTTGSDHHASAIVSFGGCGAVHKHSVWPCQSLKLGTIHSVCTIHFARMKSGTCQSDKRLHLGTGFTTSVYCRWS